MTIQLKPLLVSAAALIIGFVAPLKATNSLLTKDTLILEAKKLKGYGLFKRSYTPLNCKEISENDELNKVIPQDISKLEYGFEHVDFKAWSYENLKKKKHKYLPTFLKKFYPSKIDTANVPLDVDNTIKVIIGQKGEDKIFILDQNNNNDFRDDSIRVLKKIVFGVPALQPQPLKCHYQIYNGKEMSKDSSWVIIGLDENGRVWFSVAHHLKATFSIDNQDYEIQAINDYYLRFCFDSPKVSITAQNGIKKDSILISEIFEIGEYLKFGHSYYKFEDITNEGSKITFIREEDVSDKIGTQVGFIAPDFNGVTTVGDSIYLSDYQDEYLLLVNVTACGSPTKSYEIYKEISEHYLPRTDIIAIDATPGALKVNIEKLKLRGKFIISEQNKSIQKSYREDFCSRVCFLIGQSGHIVDKFEIWDWKQSLSKHF